jgi:hypothetical protein
MASDGRLEELYGGYRVNDVPAKVVGGKLAGLGPFHQRKRPQGSEPPITSPVMLQFPAKTLRNRLQELSELPGLDEVTAKSLILRRPELLRLSMRTVAANISALAALLGVVPAVIPHIVRFHPRLLFLSTLRSNIETTSGLLAIAQARFIAAALRQPQLLFQKPASVLARVERIGDLFNISAEEVLVLAHRQPHLLTRSPDTLIANARLAARLLRILYAEFRLIVLKAPSLDLTRRRDRSSSRPAATWKRPAARRTTR